MRTTFSYGCEFGEFFGVRLGGGDFKNKKQHFSGYPS